MFVLEFSRKLILANNCYTIQNVRNHTRMFVTDLNESTFSQIYCSIMHLTAMCTQTLGFSKYFPDFISLCQESGLVPVRLRYAPASLPASWSWPLASVVVEDQGWCHNSWLVAALETAAQRWKTMAENFYLTTAILK